MPYRYTWFKLYHEVIYDAKLQALPPWAKWLWIVILTKASEARRRGYISETEAAVQALTYSCGFSTVGEDAVTPDALRWALQEFAKMGMLVKMTRGWRVVNFTRRQYEFPSDQPRAVRKRVRKSRTQKHHGNESETTRNESETTRNESETTLKHHRGEEKREEEKRIKAPPTPQMGVTMVSTGFLIPEDLMTRWGGVYPAVDVSKEVRAAFEWAQANPANRKSNWQRFLVNWLKRAQDRAPRVAAEIPRRASPYVYPTQEPEEETPLALTDEQRVENLRKVREMTTTIGRALAREELA